MTIILDDMKFGWRESEIRSFLNLWREYRKHSDNVIGIVKQIAKDMKEDGDDILLLAIHLGREGVI